MKKISELSFITPRKVKQFEKKEICTIEDLLKIVPKKYFDCRKSMNISKEMIGKDICIIGKTITNLSVIGKDNNIFQFKIINEQNIKISIIWFNQLFMYEKLDIIKKGNSVLVFGRLTYSEKYNSYTISNPKIFTNEIEKHRKIIPIYKKIGGMSEEYYLNAVREALFIIDVEENLDEKIRKKFNLCEYNRDFFRKIHQPNNICEIEETQRRMIFDDLYYFAKHLLEETNEIQNSDFKILKRVIVDKAISNLPFELTNDQINTVNKVIETAMVGKRINALVQGDVGCGKTIVAFLSMIAFAENGYQSVIMAPTQVLAKQHFEGLKDIGEKYNYQVAYLHSGMKVKEKREVLSKIKNGEYQFVVGTHSVFSNDIEYYKLGLVITDEEHKFGVVQRETLAKKANAGVHIVTMSATPIPRTLALTLYGENKEVYTISQMPSGRKPVVTGIATNDEKVFSFMKKSIAEGRQCYVVCPLIKDSESEKLENVESVETIYKKLIKYFTHDKQIQIAMLTGKQSAEEVSKTIKNFQENKTQILISTTVIEVGVNVPNASVIVIRNAERFGLAQLHQLRGRVGRGSYQSYCVLCSEDKENERLLVMCKTNNGFELANADLQQRGMGDLIGTKQSGDNKYVELMLRYPKFYEKVKDEIKKSRV